MAGRISYGFQWSIPLTAQPFCTCNIKKAFEMQGVCCARERDNNTTPTPCFSELKVWHASKKQLLDGRSGHLNGKWSYIDLYHLIGTQSTLHCLSPTHSHTLHGGWPDPPGITRGPVSCPRTLLHVTEGSRNWTTDPTIGGRLLLLLSRSWMKRNFQISQSKYHYFPVLLLWILAPSSCTLQLVLLNPPQPQVNLWRFIL